MSQRTKPATVEKKFEQLATEAEGACVEVHVNGMKNPETNEDFWPR
ncbi:hypothetical protein [Rhodalgimonas zhirmunskyi]|nr:hypothetical protein [Rhodoalgimonas zhirmunskyi]